MKKNPDFPYVALAGKPDGSVLLVDWRREPGDTHIELRPAGQFHTIEYDLGNIDAMSGRGDVVKNPQAVEAGAKFWTEAIKLSRLWSVRVYAGVVYDDPQGEDIIDSTDCEDVMASIARGYVRGRYFSTTKGGCRKFALHVGTQHGHGTQTDHDVGNWYDYSRRKTTETTFDVVMLGNDRPRSRVLHADRPKYVGGPWDVNVPWWRPAFYPAMTVAKKLKIA